MGMLLTVGREHPSLDGHFPGQPIVPAVVILNLVIQSVESAYPQQRVTGVKRVKWLRPLRPDAACELEIEKPHNGRLRFRCHLAGELIAEGNLLCTER